MTSFGTTTQLLPCDRGGGVRDFHYFQASQWGVCCVYCGKSGVPQQPPGGSQGAVAGGAGSDGTKKMLPKPRWAGLKVGDRVGDAVVTHLYDDPACDEDIVQIRHDDGLVAAWPAEDVAWTRMLLGGSDDE